LLTNYNGHTAACIKPYAIATLLHLTEIFPAVIVETYSKIYMYRAITYQIYTLININKAKHLSQEYTGSEETN